MSKFICVILVFISSSFRLLAQATECGSYLPIIDSVGKPFFKDIVLLAEVGLIRDEKYYENPSDRLLQFPYFIPYKDTVNLFNNYTDGFYSYIDAFSLLKERLNAKGISFIDGVELNKKITLIKEIKKAYLNIKYEKKGRHKAIKNLRFEYKVYKLRIKAIYIGRYCRKIPYNFIRKNEPLFIDRSLDVFLILDIAL